MQICFLRFFLGKKITDSFFIYKIENRKKRVPSQHKIHIITQALHRKQTFLKVALVSMRLPAFLISQ